MTKEIIRVRTGFIRRNRYGWDICDDDFWGTGYSLDINDAYLYSNDGIQAKEITYKESFSGHTIQTYKMKSGKFGARCLLCGSTHSGRPKSTPEIAYTSVFKKECSKTYKKIELVEGDK